MDIKNVMAHKFTEHIEDMKIPHGEMRVAAAKGFMAGYVEALLFCRNSNASRAVDLLQAVKDQNLLPVCALMDENAIFGGDGFEEKLKEGK